MPSPQRVEGALRLVHQVRDLLPQSINPEGELGGRELAVGWSCDDVDDVKGIRNFRVASDDDPSRFDPRLGLDR